MNTSPKRTTLILLGVLWLVSLLPLAPFSTPPLSDYPNHLARQHVHVNLNQSPSLQRYYHKNWAWQPNLAMDLIVPPLARLMPIHWAGKCFLAILFLLLLGGVTVLHAALYREWSPWPLLAVLFLYNRIFLWGFVNYLFGVGLALWVLAAWIYLKPRPWFLRLTLFALLSLVVYLSHLAAFLFFAITLVVYEFSEWWSQTPRAKKPNLQSLSALLVPLLVPVGVYFSTSQGSNPANVMEWGTLRHKLLVLASGVRNFHDRLALVSCVLLFGVVVLLLVSKRLCLHKGLVACAGVILVLTLVAPEVALGGDYIDTRLFLPAYFLLASAATWKFKKRWETIGVLIIATTFFVVSTGVLLYDWKPTVDIEKDLNKALRHIPEGSKLLPVYVEPSPRVSLPIWRHMPNLAIISKAAWVPTLFTMSRQQPIQMKQPYRSQAKQLSSDLINIEKLPLLRDRAYFYQKSLFRLENLRHYDYLLIFRQKHLPHPLGKSLRKIFEGRYYHLYQIKP
ncbi:MAG: hypothetical protein EP343_16020 [Deltaproteobacteria bacterium]|nr:MAG: hypothetical protein EP343_16020 [Deltaproteobacteria bacterium]